ncbi:MAG: di-trans,poly-cis-decaprenylcistransferase [Candidatus Dormibacteraeota bacterium]|nr:di-trans,poly-cis-decaprenylcistransferase [Candidatus Dormibacteraeota bacterium]
MLHETVVQTEAARAGGPPPPRHVGIIMDGNGRWARRRGRPHSFGHRAGVRALKRVMYACEPLGVQVLSAYTFSTENWGRPRAEVRGLMRLFHEAIQREIDEIDERGIRIVVSGRRSELSPRMRARIVAAEERTANNLQGVLNVCLNYGGRAELVDAVRDLVRSGIAADRIDEDALRAHLYHPELPDPDLIIRTAGESRMSNFLLWESAYSELYVTETLWPDFDEEDLRKAVADYQSRVRRFGGRPELETSSGGGP